MIAAGRGNDAQTIAVFAPFSCLAMNVHFAPQAESIPKKLSSLLNFSIPLVLSSTVRSSLGGDILAVESKELRGLRRELRISDRDLGRPPPPVVFYFFVGGWFGKYHSCFDSLRFWDEGQNLTTSVWVLRL